MTQSTLCRIHGTGGERERAFTLVELMIVVGIIGILAVIAIPAMERGRINAQNSAFINDLRIAVAAFEQYATEKGSYPPDVMPAVMPQGMGPYLAKMKWTAKTPIGGQWDWDYMQFVGKIGVSVYIENTYQDSRLTEIDRIIDDGDLSTGGFQKRSQGYISIIEQR